MNRISHFQAGVVPKNGVVKKLLGAAFAAACAAAAPAQAGIIDFEGFFGPVGGTESIQQAGFDLAFYANVADGGEGSLVGAFFDGSDPFACVEMACPNNNPGTYYGALNDGYIDITASTAQAQFQIKSFDASFIGGSAILSSYPAVSGLLRIQGIRANGTSLIQDYLLNGPGAGGFNFAHFNTTTAFGNTAFVEALLFGFACNTAGSCSAFSTDRAQFGIDNLALVEVPEPSSILLFGLGMAGMGAALRRRSRSNGNSNSRSNRSL